MLDWFLYVCIVAAGSIAVLISIGLVVPTLNELAIVFSLFVAFVCMLLLLDAR